MVPGEALRQRFGFEHFRPGQAEAVTAARVSAWAPKLRVA